MSRAYIDVRGVWPVYVNGLTAYELQGMTREVTVEQVEEIQTLLDDEWDKEKDGD